MNSLVIRIVSALVAATGTFATYYFFSIHGLAILGIILVFVGFFEFSKVAFPEAPFVTKFLFILFSFLIFLTEPSPLPHTYILKLHSFNLTLCWFILYASLTLWTTRGSFTSEKLQKFLSVSFLGFLYCAIFPSYIFRLLYSNEGHFLLLSFLLIVFAGDTFAYAGGLFLGKRKLHPTLSPKKTFEGSFFGLLGSLLFGYFSLTYFYNPFDNTLFLIIAVLITAIIAQTGDLFESMIKRTANVKDTGQILPGHGGILDRLDGVYFAAPVFFYFCSYMNT